MKLFENGVGRPSNEIKKKRRLFVLGVSLGAVLLVGLGSFLTINATKQNMVTNPKRLKGASTALNTKLADLNKDGKVTRNDLVKLKERLKSTNSSKIPGDVNLDEVITYDDAYHALYYTFIPDKYPIASEANADMDGNGKIDSDDALYIANMIESLYGKEALYAYGDLNGDYRINNTDYNLLVDYLNSSNKINTKTINYKTLKISGGGYTQDNNSKMGFSDHLFGQDSNIGYNMKTGNYWGSEGINIYARRKGTVVKADISNLGDLSNYSKVTVYYKYAGDGKDMKSNVIFYMNGIKRYSKDLTLTTTKDGTTKWSASQKVTFGLYHEVGSNNTLTVYLDHGMNKKSNTAIVKITKIVLE